MTMNDLDADGYRTIKAWGVWLLKQHHEEATLQALEHSGRSYYHVRLEDVFGPGARGVDEWIAHISWKPWPDSDKEDFARALRDLEATR